ncbi:molybdopterin molybdotransferase MoeA [Aidingimonas lacisalsi]|uniref:molybdopterin molybdotransferase MoeA n=1 Tax=Aidingimonas lacisalsi TaxID=2604086 RepID=UPI0011D2882A|nr:gephyrin-like molybdotransferase Glp [Aidingimonas lacisalsi]
MAHDAGRDSTLSLTSVESALDALLRDVMALDGERIACDDAAGRVLAEDITARLDVPGFDNSAMDGYAFHHADVGRPLSISQRIVAGQPATALEPETCARIFTGSEIPPGADTVIMQEQVSFNDDGSLSIHDPRIVDIGDNIRRQGQDVRAGDRLLVRGTKLEAAALGQLAGQGITTVTVTRAPRVALLSTGDEIVPPGKPLAPGQIYNSNRPMLKRLLERFGAHITMTADVPDAFEATCRLLQQAAQDADVVVTTGGVSVGEEDHVKQALETLGQLDLWRLAMRPGKPLALGRLPAHTGACRFVGLPGNPVSGYVGAWIYLRPLMGALLGCPALSTLPSIPARAAFATQTQARRHYMRATLSFTEQGPIAHAAADQNSAVLSSCIQANALAVIPEHSHISEGDEVECLWLLEG